MKRRELHPEVRNWIRRVEGRNKITIDPLRWFTLLSELDDFARHLKSPPKIVSDSAILDIPVVFKVEGQDPIRFWRISLWGIIWLTECAQRWWSHKPSLILIARLYMHCFSRDRTLREKIGNAEDAEKILMAWANSITVSLDHLREASQMLTTPFEETDGNYVGSYWDSAGTLAAATGRSLDYWLFDVSADVVIQTLEEYTNKRYQEASMLAIVASAGSGGVRAPDPNSPSVIWLNKWTVAREQAEIEIVTALKKEQGEAT